MTRDDVRSLLRQERPEDALAFLRAEIASGNVQGVYLVTIYGADADGCGGTFKSGTFGVVPSGTLALQVLRMARDLGDF